MKIILKRLRLLFLGIMLASACTGPMQPIHEDITEPPTRIASTLTTTPTGITLPEVVASPEATFAQNAPHLPSPSPTPWPTMPLFTQAGWTSFTNGNYIRDLLFDYEGYLWAAGSGGVVKWDLAQGTYVKFTSEHGLASNNVQTLALGPDGALWFGTRDAGVSRYDGKIWMTYTTKDGLASNDVASIAVAPDGSLWFYGSAGISKYVNGTWIALGDIKENRITFVDTSLAISPNGTAWFGAREDFGLIREDETGRTRFFAGQELLSNYITAIALASDGGVWVGTDRGLAYYDGRTWRNFTEEDGLPSPYVADILPMPDGKVWVSFSEDIRSHDDIRFEWVGQPVENVGVALYDGKSWTTFTEEDGLVDNEILAMALGLDGKVCFGAYRDGVSCFNGQTWKTYQTHDNLLDNDVRVMAVSASNVWMGHPTGVSNYDGNDWRSYTTADGLANNNIVSIYLTPSGEVWFGTLRDLSHFNGQVWTNFSEDRQRFIVAIAALPDGTLLFGAGLNGVSSFDGERWEAVFTPPIEVGISAIAVTQDGAIWVGAMFRGLYHHNGNKWINYTEEDGLIKNWVDTMAIDPKGGLWAGTREGLSHFDGVNWSSYTMQDGLVYRSVTSIALTAEGVLIIGTANGVSIFNGETWTTITSHDGLASNKVREIVVGSGGEIWFATEAGVSRYVLLDE